MASVNSRETVAALVALQKLDDTSLRIQRRLKEGPPLVEKRGEKYRAAKEKLDQDREAVRKYRAAVQEIEVTLKQREGEIAKIRTQQETARTNQEFAAFGDHADRIKVECDALEDRILEGYAKADEADEEVSRYAAKVAALEKEQAEFLTQWKHDEAEYLAELEASRKARDDFAKNIAEDAVLIYDRIAKIREGDVVVPVHLKVCGACRMALVPNDFARLMTGDELITCNSCQRIIYVPTLHGA